MPGTNLTREEATERAGLVSTDHYVVELDLTTGEERFGSTTTLRFGAVPGSSTFVDLVGAEIGAITLNGTSLDPATYADSRIPLPDLQAENELVVEATCAYSHSGEGLHRFVERRSHCAVHDCVFAILALENARRIALASPSSSSTRIILTSCAGAACDDIMPPYPVVAH